MSKERQGMGQRGNKPTRDIEFTVTECSGLLDYLLRQRSNESRNHVKSWLTHRSVSVDGCIVTQYDYTLHPGQTIRIAPSSNRGQKKMLDILYEDDDLIVINKPAGLLSIATNQEKEQTAYHFLTDYVKQSNPKDRVFAVHRLDRDTSGVLMVAKNERIKRALQNDWADLVSKRSYVAIVEGQLTEKSGRIRSWLKETKTMLIYGSSRPGDGLEAITNYQVIRENKAYSWLHIQLETGRKNQIRVHMKEMGNSVVGDKKYGAKTNPLRRLALHADQLVLRHPFSGETMCFTAKTPTSFQALFQQSTHKQGTSHEDRG